MAKMTTRKFRRFQADFEGFLIDRNPGIDDDDIEAVLTDLEMEFTNARGDLVKAMVALQTKFNDGVEESQKINLIAEYQLYVNQKKKDNKNARQIAKDSYAANQNETNQNKTNVDEKHKKHVKFKEKLEEVAEIGSGDSSASVIQKQVGNQSEVNEGASGKPESFTEGLVTRGVTVADLSSLCGVSYRSDEESAKRSLRSNCAGYESLGSFTSFERNESLDRGIEYYADAQQSNKPRLVDVKQESPLHPWQERKSGLRFTVVQPTDEKWEGKETPKPIIIAVKGTEPPFSKKGTFLKDMVSNFKLWWHGKPVHQQQLDLNVEVDHIRSQYPNRPVIVTGHSLGGSLANHAVAQQLKNDGTANIRAVTFGDPGIDPSTRKKIIEHDHSNRFIAFQNTKDRVAGCLGSFAGGASYSLESTSGHFIDKYSFREKTGEKVDNRVKAIGALDVSGDLPQLHQRLFEKEVERLKATDRSYLKKDAPEKAKTPKLWVAEKALELAKAEGASVDHTNLFAEAMRMERSPWWRPSSAWEVPQLSMAYADFAESYKKVCNSVEKEIERLAKDDRKYTRSDDHETLKLTLLRLLYKELGEGNVTSNAFLTKEEDRREELQQALNAIYSMHRDEGRLRFEKHSSTASSPASSPTTASPVVASPVSPDERSTVASSPTESTASSKSSAGRFGVFFKKPKPAVPETKLDPTKTDTLGKNH